MPEIIIPGPEGRIEARYSPGNSAKPPLSIILHPHSRQGCLLYTSAAADE